MKTMEVACPQCKAKYQIRCDYIGRRARCAKCKTVFAVSQSSEPEGIQEERIDSLTCCRYCGFHDTGNFCSSCGGRLRGGARIDLDLEKCLIPEPFFNRFPSDYTIDINAPQSKQAEQRRLRAIRQQCERYNEEIAEMAREIKYGELGSWRFSRVKIDRLVDQIPNELPDRELVVTRLWATVTDVERAVAKAETEEAAAEERAQIEEEFAEIEDALKASDARRASKRIKGLRAHVKETRDPEMAKRIAQCEAGLRSLEATKIAEKQSLAYQKLLDKADKLAFQKEWKKAVKAYQACQFWLSRNDLPSKAQCEVDVEQKLLTAESSLT